MVFTTEVFFEVAIESWPEWDLNPQPLNSVQTLQPTELSGHEFSSRSEPILYSYTNFIFSSISDFISAIVSVSRHIYFNRNLVEGSRMIHIAFATEGFFEVAIESWSECMSILYVYVYMSVCIYYIYYILYIMCVCLCECMNVCMYNRKAM